MNSIEVRHVELYIESLYALKGDISNHLSILRKLALPKVDNSFHLKAFNLIADEIEMQEALLLKYKLS